MKGFKVFRKDMLAALKAPAAVCDGRSAVPILANVRMDVDGAKAKLFATDTDIGVEVACPVLSELSGVSVAVPPKQMLAIFKNLGEDSADVSIEDKVFKLTIRAGRNRYRVNGLDAADYPMPSDVDAAEAVRVEVEAGELKRGLRCVDYAAVKDASRPLLSSVCVDVSAAGVTLVATDSRRLAAVGIEAKATLREGRPAQAVLPLKAVALLEKMLGDEEPVVMLFDSRRAVLEIGEKGKDGYARLTMKLMEGKYPAYGQVIPKTANETAKVGRQDLLLTVERVSAALMAGSQVAVTLTVSSTQLEVGGKGENGEASGVMEAAWSGKTPARATYNASFLAEPLKTLMLDNVELRYGKDPAMDPLVVASNAENFSYVLMPIRED